MQPSKQKVRYEKTISAIRQFLNEEEMTINNIDLLAQAFTHSSYVNENKTRITEDNERLEFLGDAILELLVSDYLYNAYPHMNEGELTKLRAAIVCEASLKSFAGELGFSRMIFLGRGEEASGGRERPALLADVFEAFIGALYLDQGLEAVLGFLKKHVYPKVKNGDFDHVMDYKSQLQEAVQRQNLGTLAYNVVSESGPAHHREFVSNVLLNDQILGSGKGRSKKESEQQAAQIALKEMK